MQPLSASDILHAWELGQRQHPVERALIVLMLSTGATRDRLARLPIGERDALLLSLREATLGSRLESAAICPVCSQQVEMRFQASDIRVSVLTDQHSLAPEGEKTSMINEGRLMYGEFESLKLTYRLPNSEDIVVILSAGEAEEARQALLRRCVIEVLEDGSPFDPANLSPKAMAWLGERIVDADPQADVVLELVCPNCNHVWQAIFDIAAFFWKEIESLSKRLLHDVHTLARAYGWREADILSMSATRRQAYLDMVMG